MLHLDCRHYLGDRPCRYARACEGCPRHAPMGTRVLIVKLGALGDVVRTACLLPTLAARSAVHITWLTSPAARALVERMPGVDRVLTFEPHALEALRVERFDLVLSLDKEPGPCAVAESVQTDDRRGIGLSQYGTVYPLNAACGPYFELGLDDEAKFHRNQKTYPQLIHEALDLEYAGHGYTLVPTDADRAAAADVLEQLGDSTVVGLNPGAGYVFANKAWRAEGYVKLVRRLAADRPDLRFLLLGGRDEAGLVNDLERTLGSDAVVNAGVDHALGPFAALVEACDVVVSGDTLAMHLAIATGRRAVAIFGPTCAQEIDLFGRGEKIATPIDCAPCYRRGCDKSPNCQDMIRVDTVVNAVARQLDAVSEAAQ